MPAYTDYTRTGLQCADCFTGFAVVIPIGIHASTACRHSGVPACRHTRSSASGVPACRRTTLHLRTAAHLRTASELGIASVGFWVWQAPNGSPQFDQFYKPLYEATYSWAKGGGGD